MVKFRFFAFVALSFLSPAVASATLPYRATFTDPGHLLDAEKAAILANLDAAVADWSRFIVGQGTVTIELKVIESTPTGRFAGGSTGNAYSGTWGEFKIFEGSGTYKLRTGLAVDANRPDISIEIQPEYLHRYLWIDPNPTARQTPVPAGFTDLVTALAHELGHGFGIEGWINPQTGAYPVDRGLSRYDTFINVGSGQGDQMMPIFTGPIATQLYGSAAPIFFIAENQGDVILTQDGRRYGANLSPTQNIYHLGRFKADQPESDLSFFSIMSASWQSPEASRTVGWRIPVNALDAALIRDLGVEAR